MRARAGAVGDVLAVDVSTTMASAARRTITAVIAGALTGTAIAAALRRFGYAVARQSGSHVRLVCAGRAPVTVPLHATLKRGTLRSILRAAKISVEEFVEALAS